MYIYQLTYEDEGSLLMIGYFGSWKKARSVMKLRSVPKFV